MRSIGLHHLGIADHVQQHERHQRHLIFPGELAIRVVEGDRIVPPVNRERLHPAQQHRDAARLRGLDDVTQVRLELRDRHPAQPVVRAQRDDEHPNVAVEGALEAPDAAG